MASQRAGAFLRALAAHCRGGGWERVPEEWRTAADRAARQVAERAVTEPSFRGALVDAVAVAERLEATAAGLPIGERPVLEVLLLAVEGLGFAVKERARLVLGEVGVDAVYQDSATTVEFAAVRASLLEYLAGHPVEIWRLSDGQAECALQWWKTYVRQMLLDREPGVHLLRNLVHACDGPDADYLLGRLPS
ncbi:hypothetical protein ACFY00_05465 [Kitasatospora sp. NPDC001540]|uniref:hypothetical protein n=1 Tax=Kitasatospora sp. NPDC001540 TaxID=3364014 RepID=UPI0036BF19E9